jgi:hypothetical protein
MRGRGQNPVEIAGPAVCPRRAHEDFAKVKEGK